MHQTSIVMAALSGDWDSTCRLLAAGGNADELGVDGMTALMVTSDLRIIDLLASYGANVNQADDHGATALMHQTQRGNYEIVERLVSLGADTSSVDHAGDSAAYRRQYLLWSRSTPARGQEYVLQESLFLSPLPDGLGSFVRKRWARF